MKIKAYAIRDTKIERSNLPFFARDDREACTIIFRAGLPKSIYEDTELYFVGEFDDDTGIFTAVDTQVRISLPPYPSDKETM